MVKLYDILQISLDFVSRWACKCALGYRRRDFTIRNIIVKIRGCSECTAEDVGEWLVCDSSALDFIFLGHGTHSKYERRTHQWPRRW